MPDTNLDINEKLEELKVEVINSIKNELENDIQNEKLGRAAPNSIRFQKICCKELKRILLNNFMTAEIEINETDSRFPDLKMIYNGSKIAFDIKSSSAKSPAYDIARLDTVYTERLMQFVEEYDIVIRYNINPDIILNVYFQPMRYTVGINRQGETRFRLYDGKLRPKSWREFDRETKNWENKEEFKNNIRNTIISRYDNLIDKFLVPILNTTEKEKFKDKFV